jgi:signal transduction histidine kinase
MRWSSWLVAPVMRWVGRHQLVADALFAALIGGLSIAGLLSATPDGTQRDADAIGVAFLTAQAVALVFRRRAPLVSLAALSVPVIAFWVRDYATNFDVISLIGVYSATANSTRARRRVSWVVGGVIGLLTVVALLGVLSPEEDLPPVAVLGIAAIHVTAAVVGEMVHDRRLRVVELEERAIRAEAERELLAREAVLRERAEIARDLHDVVAHGMSVMVVQAGAAQRLLATQPERAAEALEHVQVTGREALSEMRRMLGVLRSEDRDAELTPQPTLADLGAMVQRCNDAGVPVELTIEGTPSATTPGAEVAVYRVAQEALTNVIRHAGRPARATVRVTFLGDRVRLEVDDDGRGASPDELRSTTGHGLVGMRERVELYGGTLHAHARPGGGFRVAATIPLVPEPVGASSPPLRPVPEQTGAPT